MNYGDNKLIIRMEKRNGRKSWTLIENLDVLNVEPLELKSVLKYLKKKLACNGCLKTDKDSDKTYIQFQGKHADGIQELLVKKKLIAAENMVVVGTY